MSLQSTNKGLRKETKATGKGVHTTLKLENQIYKISANISAKDNTFMYGNMFVGEWNSTAEEKTEIYKLAWKFSKHPNLMIKGTAKSDLDHLEIETVMDIAEKVKTAILEKAERTNHILFDLVNGASPESNTKAESEVATDSLEPEVEDTKEEDKIIAPEKDSTPDTSAAKAYCKSLGTTSSLAALAHLLANPKTNTVEVTNQVIKTVEVVKAYTDEELEAIMYERMPAEIMAKVNAYDELIAENESLKLEISKLKNIQPEVKAETPVVENNIDIAKLKAEIKSELKAELLAELNVSTKAPSQPAPIKEEKKADEKVDTNLVIPGRTTKKEETKPSAPAPEAPKKKSIRDLTIEDLTEMEYTKLQGLGSKLGLGAKNVAKKADLVELIAVKLKIKAATKKESDVDTNLVLTKTSNSSLAEKRKANTWTSNEETMLDEILEEDFVSTGGEVTTIELNDGQKATAKFFEDALAKFKN